MRAFRASSYISGAFTSQSRMQCGREYDTLPLKRPKPAVSIECAQLFECPAPEHLDCEGFEQRRRGVVCSGKGPRADQQVLRREALKPRARSHLHSQRIKELGGCVLNPCERPRCVGQVLRAAMRQLSLAH
mmetsp:Transcript_35355/g.82621  ORF Transcript_35355/g.82621 Transcript_35355/m.82621 type:complete len:131 (+) Transcript_35355:409-801(+)